MDFEYTKEERAFRDELRAFMQAELPADISAKVKGAQRLVKDDYLRWQKILFKKGWGAPSWPVEYGGTGWNAVHRHIFDEVCNEFGAPPQISFGLKMVSPVIMRYGNDEQKKKYLPRILSGTDWWCQGYSEPGSGSDLASLKTRAERQGDHYVVNGQKTWTTLAHHADMIFCLVRTSNEGKRQEGISFLLIDMKTPGIEVRPIRLLDGEHEVNEVWLTDVKVPLENRVGEENKGWTYAKFLLGHERTGSGQTGASRKGLESLKRLARQQPGNDGRPLIEDVRFRDHVARVEMELMALEILNLKVISADGKAQTPGPEVSILKIRGSEIRQRLTELYMQALGVYGLPHLPEMLDAGWSGDPMHAGYTSRDAAASGQYFNFRKTTIYGGSNEVQRNIISKMILGL